MKILAAIIGVSLVWRWLIRRRPGRVDRVICGGIAGRNMSIIAPDDQTAVEVLITICELPVGTIYGLDLTRKAGSDKWEVTRGNTNVINSTDVQ